MKNFLAITIVMMAGLVISACALHEPVLGVKTAGPVRTTLSSPVVVAPVPMNQRKVTLDVSMSLQANDLSKKDLVRHLSHDLRKQGYIIVNDKRTTSVIKLQVFFAGLTSLDAAQDILLQGNGGAYTPAGAQVIGNKLYYHTAGESPAVYAVLADLDITQNGKNYRTRMLSVYQEKYATMTAWSNIKPQLTKGVAGYVAAIM